MIYNVVEYQFGSGQTIEAAIKLVNNHSMTRTLLTGLMKQYTIINGGGVPKLGQKVYLPVYEDYIGKNEKFPVITIEV